MNISFVIEIGSVTPTWHIITNLIKIKVTSLSTNWSCKNDLPIFPLLLNVYLDLPIFLHVCVCACVCVCVFFLCVYIYIYIIKDQYILCHCDWVCYSYMTHYHQPNINKSHQFLYQLILKKWSSDLSPFIKCVLGRCSITSNKPFGNIFSNLVVITIIFSSI